jgi:peroxiredoxin
MIAAGEVAPDFEGESSGGERFRLGDLRGRVVVLYFFPRAFTPVCTAETRGFAAAHGELRALGAEVVGVSTDAIERQCAFADQEHAPFPLVADPDGSICRRYGVRWPLLGRARRVTFVLAESGVVEAVIRHELSSSKHVDEVLRHLRRRPRAPSEV